MASSSPSPLRSKSVHHGRSHSLPSISHPITSQFDETFSALSASSNITSFNNRVTCVTKLYHNLDHLIMLPHIQHTISQDKWANQLLEGHISVLDACDISRDLFSQMKHKLQQLLSALRRKDMNGVQCYLTSRRNSQKMIQKSLKNLKRSKNTISAEKENESSNIDVCKLKEAESATFDLIESLLSYMMHSRRSGWLIVTKLMPSNKASEEKGLSEFEKVDALLQKSQEDTTQAEELVNYLKEMELSIQVLEEKLESLFRQLIKTRVSLLNILN